jgi:hypothetical protein
MLILLKIYVGGPICLVLMMRLATAYVQDIATTIRYNQYDEHPGFQAIICTSGPRLAPRQHLFLTLQVFHQRVLLLRILHSQIMILGGAVCAVITYFMSWGVGSD